MLLEKGLVTFKKVEEKVRVSSRKELDDCTFRPKIKHKPASEEEINRFERLYSDAVRKIARSSKIGRSSDEVEWEKHQNEFTFKPNLYHPRFAKHRRRRKVRKAKGD